MCPPSHQCRSHLRGALGGFTLIELLLALAVIMLLVAITMPVVSLLNHAAITRAAQSTVLALDVAMRAYADEDSRHLFPPDAASGYLVHDPANPASTLVLLERQGYRVPFRDLDGQPGGDTYRALLDGWGQPLHYYLDGPVRVAGVIDGSRMAAAAAKPAPLDDWNPRGVRPFAYIWSVGRPKPGVPQSSVTWIHQKGTP